MVAYNLQFSFQELDPIFNDDYDTLDKEEFGERGDGPLKRLDPEVDAAGIGY